MLLKQLTSSTGSKMKKTPGYENCGYLKKLHHNSSLMFLKSHYKEKKKNWLKLSYPYSNLGGFNIFACERNSSVTVDCSLAVHSEHAVCFSVIEFTKCLTDFTLVDFIKDSIAVLNHLHAA